MKIFVDCLRGLASDMLVGALIDCFEDKQSVLQELQFNICNNMTLSADCAKSYDRTGILFRAVDNEYNPNEHRHSHSDIRFVYAFIDSTTFSENVKRSAKGVYEIIAKAEAEVHGEDVNMVHFHEVGSKRAIACIICVCALIEKLNPDEIIFSEINTGYGKVICAHGEVDVPAPATKVILKGIPNFYNSDLGGELCTPTGTAIAKYFADSFVSQSVIKDLQKRSERIATGLGSRESCLKRFLLMYGF